MGSHVRPCQFCQRTTIDEEVAFFAFYSLKIMTNLKSAFAWPQNRAIPWDMTNSVLYGIRKFAAW